jgi:hypothetical protein
MVSERGQRSRPFYFLLVSPDRRGVFALRQQANNNKIIAADCAAGEVRCGGVAKTIRSASPLSKDAQSQSDGIICFYTQHR